MNLANLTVAAKFALPVFASADWLILYLSGLRETNFPPFIFLNTSSPSFPDTKPRTDLSILAIFTPIIYEY